MDQQLGLLQGQAKGAVELFDAGRLTQARQAKGWTKRFLAERVAITPTAIGQFEAGVTRPRPALLAQLAQALDVTPSFFAAGRPRACVDAVSTHFRSLRSMRVYERDMAVAFAGQVWELAHALEEHVRLPELDLPQVGEPAIGPAAELAPGQLAVQAAAEVLHSGGHAVSAAQIVRKAWGFGDQPVAHLVRQLEAHGVLVAMLPFSDGRRVDAFSTAVTPRPVIVLTPDKDNVYRQRFTAAHELAHLLLHNDAAPGDPTHEREADGFAAELLLPGALLRHQLPARLDFPRLLALQQTWGVSVEALLYRGRELGVYSESTHRRARIKVHDLRAQGLVPSGPLRDYRGEQPLMLCRAFDTAVHDAGQTPQSIAAQLGWTSAALARVLDRTPDDRPPLRLVQP